MELLISSVNGTAKLFPMVIIIQKLRTLTHGIYNDYRYRSSDKGLLVKVNCNAIGKEGHHTELEKT